MSIIAWIFVGLVYGFIASAIKNKPGEGTIIDILVAMAGAVLGGFLFHVVAATGVDRFNVWSMVVGVFGAIAMVSINNALMGRGAAQA